MFFNHRVTLLLQVRPLQASKVADLGRLKEDPEALPRQAPKAPERIPQDSDVVELEVVEKPDLS